MRRNLYAAIVATLAFAPGIAGAAELMPSFANVPTGWSTDRYNPDSFTNIGTVNGRSNVLGIGIGPNGAFANRPSAYQSQFYDTQGMGHSISGGSGNSLSAGLYIPSSWLNSANGVVRTDMWGVMNSGTFNAITDYPIIGFTNHGANGYVGLQVHHAGLQFRQFKRLPGRQCSSLHSQLVQHSRPGAEQPPASLRRSRRPRCPFAIQTLIGRLARGLANRLAPTRSICPRHPLAGGFLLQMNRHSAL